MKLDDLFISPNATLVDALRQLDATARGILFVVRDGDHLAGTLTDGDIRRAILDKGSLDGLVSDACNGVPVALPLSERGVVNEVMRKKKIGAIPIVDGDDVIVDCAFVSGQPLRRSNHGGDGIPVVMMAGGLGTRLYPYTKVLPKPLIPVNDIPIAERIINSFYELGCKTFYLIVNHKKEMIKAYFNGLDTSYEIEFIDEQEFLGTGGGLKLLEGQLDSTFVLTNCDILVRFDIDDALRLHYAHDNAVTMVTSLKEFCIPYGTIDIDAGGSVSKLVEKPSMPYLVNTGCYIVEPDVISCIGQGESMGFPDVVMRCKEHGMHIGAYPISEKSWLDMGEPKEWRNMAEALDD